jgi:hypothetical protein
LDASEGFRLGNLDDGGALACADGPKVGVEEGPSGTDGALVNRVLGRLDGVEDGPEVTDKGSDDGRLVG